jgi:hypothetical protein
MVTTSHIFVFELKLINENKVVLELQFLSVVHTEEEEEEEKRTLVPWSHCTHMDISSLVTLDTYHEMNSHMWIVATELDKVEA